MAYVPQESLCTANIKMMERRTTWCHCAPQLRRRSGQTSELSAGHDPGQNEEISQSDDSMENHGKSCEKPWNIIEHHV